MHILKNHARSLNDLLPGVKIGKKNVDIEPSVLFMSCTALAHRESEDTKSYAKYELASTPTPLFKDSYMRKTSSDKKARQSYRRKVPRCIALVKPMKS